MAQQVYRYQSSLSQEEIKAKVAAQQPSSGLPAIGGRMVGQVFGENIRLRYQKGFSTSIQLSSYYHGRLEAAPEGGTYVTFTADEQGSWHSLLWGLRLLFLGLAAAMVLSGLFAPDGFSIFLNLILPLIFALFAFGATSFFLYFGKEEAAVAKEKTLQFIRFTLQCAPLPEEAPESEGPPS